MSVTKITDANALYEIARLYTSAFPAYNSEMKRVLQVEKIVEYSDNADTLQKETPAQIIKQAKDAIEAHRKNLQNPHNETVESIGTLTGDYFKSLVVNKMPTGVLPISAFGYDYKSWADKSIVGWFTVVGENLVVGPNVTVMMNGSEFPIPAGTYDLREVHANWRTVPIFIYFRQVEGVPVLDLLAMNQKDTRTLMLGGVIRAGNTTPEMQRTIKVGSYRLSSTPVGQATAVGLNAFNSNYGIHRGWVPSTNVLQPAIPPKVEIKLLDYDRGNGANGYITSSQGGELLLQADVGVDPNIYFTLDGENVTVTATVEVLSGAAPVVTKVSNTQFRVRCATYSNSRITFTARIPSGDTATYTLRTEHRTNLSIRYNTGDFAIGSYGGLTKLTAMINVSRWFNVALTGDGVVTRFTTTAVTGSNYTLSQVNNNTFSVIGPVDAMGLVTVYATDKYGRSSSFSIYIEVRTAYPPIIINPRMYRGSGSLGGRACGGSNTCLNYEPGPSSLRSYGFPSSISRSGCTTMDWILFDINPECTVSIIQSNRGGAIPPYALFQNHGTGFRLSLRGGVCVRTVKPGQSAPTGWTLFTVRITNAIGEYTDYATTAYFTPLWWAEQEWDGQTASCFPFESLITMADGKQKPIGEIDVGDFVMTSVGPQEVWRVHEPILGNRKLMSFEGKCKTSAEHNFWAKSEDGTEEFWATRDLPTFVEESLVEEGPNFDDRLPLDFSNVADNVLTVAHKGGWKTVRSVVEESTPDLQLYNLRLKGGGSYFVDGYLVSSRASVDNDVDWNNFKWNGEIQYNYPKRDWLYKQDIEGKDTYRYLKKNGLI